ncbi:outer membrane, YaiO family domain protein [Burkholderia pseudomallei]|uniref:YaiO family outer membrane beta-barrel protein n=1 Tax=Burkholderia pseudomallei TaxID=28450 RepID=UPI00052AB069|nr:YaiO family outer membrane beta-barrel protein [Burkholderia pseudomallei]AIV76116.1 outer membrane, YaiO family domain protein [Burkholderia pseudomallei]
MHAFRCRRGPPVPLAIVALACACVFGAPRARAAAAHADAPVAASIASFEPAGGPAAAADAADTAVMPAPPASFAPPAAPPVPQVASLASSASTVPTTPTTPTATTVPPAPPAPIASAPAATPLSAPPAAAPLVIVPRRFDDTALVKVDSEGMLDGWPLAEVAPNQENQPALPEALVAHVQAPAQRHTELSLAYSMAHLTNGYGDWYGVHLRGLYQAGGRTIIGELAQLHRFNESTQLGAITYIQDMGPDWFGGIGFSGTTSGTILPSARVDLSLNRKLLSNRSLVLSAGAGYAWNRNGHRDQLYHLGAIWYAVPKWIFEAGWNYTVDSPGSVKAPAYYGAITYGEVGKSLIVLRGSFGREAYQATGNNAQITDFRSHEVSLKWRYWVTRKWGTQVEFDYYHNPYYSRIGGEIGMFYRW